MEYKERVNEDELLINPITGKRKCEICGKKESSYTCPKCNIPYCNLNCYRNTEKHLTCSENFYHDQIVEELKQINLEKDMESRNKMAQILLKESKQYEKDLVSEEIPAPQPKQKEQISEEEMLKLYEDEINKWKPWWKTNENLKESLLQMIDENNSNQNKFNLNLVKNSTNINTSNASQFILNDILQMTYHYIMIASIYQLNENDFTDYSKELNESNLVKELVNNFIQLENLTNNNSLSKDLKTKFDFVVSILSEETKYFLKSYINRCFLVGMLDELIYLVEWPELIVHCLSKIYNIFETYIRLITISKKMLDNDLNDKLDTGEIQLDLNEEHPPLNVFYLNREIVKKQASNKPKRVEILTKSNKTNSTIWSINNNFDDKENFGKREARMFMKKIEFFFKWLIDHKQMLKSSTSPCKQNSIDQLNQVKLKIENEMKELNEEKKYFEKNLNQIRSTILNKKQALIEELS